MQLSSTEKYVTDPQQFNNYSYSRNNPINLVDPLGLEATIIIRNGNGWNDYGHSAIEVDGTVYEYSLESPATIPQMIAGVSGTVDTDIGLEGFFEGYANNGQTDSFQTITVDTTDEQNQSIIGYFESLAGDIPEYELFSNNCTTVLVDALENAGVADFYDGVEWDSDNPWDVTYHNDPITPAGLAGEVRNMNQSDGIEIIDQENYTE